MKDKNERARMVECARVRANVHAGGAARVCMQNAEKNSRAFKQMDTQRKTCASACKLARSFFPVFACCELNNGGATVVRKNSPPNRFLPPEILGRHVSYLLTTSKPLNFQGLTLLQWSGENKKEREDNREDRRGGKGGGGGRREGG